MRQASRRRTQQERRAESEQKLLDATAELIVERGFAQLSLTAIGERAGYSHALVTHLFGTKAALIERLNDIVDELYRSRIAPAVAEKEGLASVVAFVETYLGLVTSSDPMARVHVVLWAQAVAGAPELRESRIDWDRHFRAGVAELVARATDRSNVDTDCADHRIRHRRVTTMRGHAAAARPHVGVIAGSDRPHYRCRARTVVGVTQFRQWLRRPATP